MRATVIGDNYIKRATQADCPSDLLVINTKSEGQSAWLARSPPPITIALILQNIRHITLIKGLSHLKNKCKHL